MQLIISFLRHLPNHSSPPISKEMHLFHKRQYVTNEIYCIINGKVKFLTDYPFYIHVITAWLKLKIFEIKKKSSTIFFFRSKSSLKKTTHCYLLYSKLNTSIKKLHYKKYYHSFFSFVSNTFKPLKPLYRYSLCSTKKLSYRKPLHK